MIIKEAYLKVLIKIASQKATGYEVINILSSFQPIGAEIKGVTKNYAFLLMFLGAGLMLFFLLLRLLNRYLKNYKKQEYEQFLSQEE